MTACSNGLMVDNMKSITLLAPAKINLSLSITGRRPDGYHLIRSVMQAVTLFDTVKVTRTAGNEISVRCDRPEIPCGKDNIAYRAAEQFFSAVGIPVSGLEIEIKKQIPSQAGLGGGSADGAAVLFALNRLFQAELPADRLQQIGLSVGADVPFFLIGGTALAEGIGELLSPVCPLPDCNIVISKPPVSVSTPAAYQAFDRSGCTAADASDALIAALSQKNLVTAARNIHNIFEQLLSLPEVSALKSILLSNGALQAAMSGSGSAVYGIFHDRHQAEKAFAACRTLNSETFLCRPYTAGITESEI